MLGKLQPSPITLKLRARELEDAAYGAWPVLDAARTCATQGLLPEAAGVEVSYKTSPTAKATSNRGSLWQPRAALGRPIFLAPINPLHLQFPIVALRCGAL